MVSLKIVSIFLQYFKIYDDFNCFKNFVMNFTQTLTSEAYSSMHVQRICKILVLEINLKSQEQNSQIMDLLH